MEKDFIAWFIPIFIPSLWIFVCFILMNLSGWPKLTQKFPARQMVLGEKYSWVSGRIGYLLPIRFNNVLTITISNTGFYISVFVIFRLWYSSIFIPWTAIEDIKQETIWRIPATTILIKNDVIRLSIYMKPGQAIATAFKKYQKPSQDEH